MIKNMYAIVLAAGKGTRINAKKINKVMYPLAGKPMIGYTTEILKKAGLKKIIIVVGVFKESIINYLGKSFIYAEQKKCLGTADAVKTALPFVPQGIKSVFVCYSDDTAFYPPKIIKKFINDHLKGERDLSLLTVVKQNPTLGRIIRKKGKIISIVEHKNATSAQRKIKEINTGVYCFNLQFLKQYLPMIKKNPLKKEYYLPDIVALGIRDKKKVKAVKVDSGYCFQGINTKEELIKANKKMKEKLK